MLGNDFRSIIDKFNIISNKGWIKAINNSLGAIGLTFEHELNKEPDNEFFPDYNSVEIKCLGRYSRYPMVYLHVRLMDLVIMKLIELHNCMVIMIQFLLIKRLFIRHLDLIHFLLLKIYIILN